MADTILSPSGLVQIEVGASDSSWGEKESADKATINGWFTTGPALKTANGGFGAALTPVVGDMLYASTTSAFARLAAPAVGQVLTSAGVGVAPSWSNAPAVTNIAVGLHNNLTALSASVSGEATAAGKYGGQFMSSNGSSGQYAAMFRTDRIDGGFTLFKYGTTTVGYHVTDSTGVSLTSLSDGRRKTILAEYDPGDIFDRIEHRNYVWDNGVKGFGPIAQKLYLVAPWLVVKGDDDPDKRPGDEGFEPWTIKLSPGEKMLFAEVKALRRRMAVLEG